MERGEAVFGDELLKITADEAVQKHIRSLSGLEDKGHEDGKGEAASDKRHKQHT